MATDRKGDSYFMSKPKVLVGIPTTGEMNVEAVKCLMQLEHDGVVDIISNSLVYDARDKIAMDAIENNCDYIMWLDSDMIYPANIISKLMSHNKDLCTGIYCKRVEPYTPCIYKLNEDKLVAYTDYEENKLFKVEAAGFGCMLTKVSALKKIYEKFGGFFFPVNGIGGEDLSFLRRAKDLGYELWCDSSIVCGHIGYQICVPDRTRFE